MNKQTVLSLASRVHAAIDTRASLSVVTFHRFSGRSGLPRDSIRHHISFMARTHEFVTPDTLGSDLDGRRLAMLTVDDCHADIYDHLFPIAQELGAPFVIAVPTDFFLRDQWLWFDRVQWIANAPAAQPVVEVAKRTVSLKDPEGFRWLKSFLKRTPTVQREQIIDDIARQLRLAVPGNPCDGFEAVSAEQMRRMLDSGLVHVCAHTVSHTIATVMPQDQLETELRQSKRELEEFSQKVVSSFCYPNGEQGDFDDRTTQAVRAAGFDLALLSVPGINRGNLERYHIRRVHSDSRHGLFEYRASGLDELLRK